MCQVLGYKLRTEIYIIKLSFQILVKSVIFFVRVGDKILIKNIWQNINFFGVFYLPYFGRILYCIICIENIFCNIYNSFMIVWKGEVKQVNDVYLYWHGKELEKCSLHNNGVEFHQKLNGNVFGMLVRQLLAYSGNFLWFWPQSAVYFVRCSYFFLKRNWQKLKVSKFWVMLVRRNLEKFSNFR